MKTISNKQISEISKKYGIPVLKIQLAIGVTSDNGATTIAEAKEIYRNSFYGSYKEKTAFFQWRNLVSTEEEAKDLYEGTLGSAYENIAIQKLVEVITSSNE